MMTRKSFKDQNGKTGKVGSIVRKQYSKINKVVESIEGRGAGGTALFFEGEEGRYPANAVTIVEKKENDL